MRRTAIALIAALIIAAFGCELEPTDTSMPPRAESRLTQTSEPGLTPAPAVAIQEPTPALTEPTPEPSPATTPAPTADASPEPTPSAIPTPAPDADAGESSSDRDALIALYNATNGANWTRNDGWLSDAPISEWFGVGADGDDRVGVLELVENGLSGELPPEIGSLSNLHALYLDGNQLSGEIPPELGGLMYLSGLYMSGNRLSGEIPSEFGDFENLTELYLDGNRLNGEIPSELGRLWGLRHLNLSNNLLSGEIPPELGDLENLRGLGLANNRLIGEMPPELGVILNLRHMDLSGNRLTGCVPGALLDNISSDLPFCPSPDRDALIAFYNATDGANWLNNDNCLSDRSVSEWRGVSTDYDTRVYYLHLAENGLSGAIQPEIGSLPNLETMVLAGQSHLVDFGISNAIEYR